MSSLTTYADMIDYQSFIREVGTWNFYSIQLTMSPARP